MKHKFTALGRPISVVYLTNKIIVILFFVALIFTLGLFTYRGEPFTAALISALSSAGAIFLAWAVGRELDPANDWSAFVALPVIYFVFFIVGQPSLLTLVFTILCCRLLNRVSGLQPLKSDALLIFVMGIFLHLNSFYFVLPFLVLVFFIDGLVEPAYRFQLFSALVSLAGYLIMTFLFRPGFSLSTIESAAFIYSAAAVVVIPLSVVFVSFTTRHNRILDDLNRAELNNHRIAAARFLTAAWIITEILSGGAAILLQVYPMVIIFGGIFLYHLAGILKFRSGL